jgi:hypothetical protein
MMTGIRSWIEDPEHGIVSGNIHRSISDIAYKHMT